MAIELQSNGSGDELETLNELIRNITQLTAKNNGKPMENKKQPSHHPHPPTTTTMVTSTTRVIADETDKVGSTTSTERISTDTDRSRSSTEGVGPDVFLGSSSTATPSHLAQVFTITAPTPLVARYRTGALDPYKSVHTEVDKDNKKIEVVYAETVTTTPITEDDKDQKTTLLNGTRGAFQEDRVTSIQPSTPTTLLDNTTTTAGGDGLKRDDSDEGDATPTPPEATTPLLPSAKTHEDSHPHPRRRQQQLLLLRKHLQQRNSLLTVLNATEIGTMGRTSADNVTIKAADDSELSGISQKELARVADALKALRNLAGICNNKGNTSSSVGVGGVLGNKCLNRTKTAATSAFALDRRNRVENVLARTHEEVAARTKAASSRRKLRVCGHLILKSWMDDQDTRQQ